MHYWGGVPSYNASSTMMCACGLTDSCVDEGLQCNCDNERDSDEYFEDSGYLESYEHLPVLSLHFGDTGIRIGFVLYILWGG